MSFISPQLTDAVCACEVRESSGWILQLYQKEFNANTKYWNA